MSEIERAQALKEVQMELFQLKREYELKRRRLNHVKLRLIRGAQQKRCTKCRELMDVEQFAIDKTRRDQRFPWCIECKNAEGRARYHRKKAA